MSTDLIQLSMLPDEWHSGCAVETSLVQQQLGRCMGGIHARLQHLSTVCGVLTNRCIRQNVQLAVIWDARSFD